MIAADTSTWIAFLDGSRGSDVEALDRALDQRQVVMPPAVLTELLSDPRLAVDVAQLLLQVPLLELKPRYWENAGLFRASVLRGGRKARLGDALIAQSCIDQGIPLLTRDRDFEQFAAAAGLTLNR